MSLKKQLARLLRPARRLLERSEPIAFHLAAVKRRRTEGQHYFYLGPDLGLTRLNTGPMLFVDPLDEHVCAGIIVHGLWEDWGSAVVTSLLQPAARVVEVGANVGYYTVTMAHRVGPQGHVTALEANPRLVGLIAKSVRVNGYGDRVRLVGRAAMDRPGTVDFVSFRTNSGGGHVPSVVGASYDIEQGEPERFQVEAVRLDDLDCGVVDLIRIDAEGSEPFILRGAEGLLKANPNVVICMEWSRAQISSRTSATDFIEWLSGLGFRFWKIGPPTGLTALSDTELLALDHCDVVAARSQPRLNRG